MVLSVQLPEETQGHCGNRLRFRPSRCTPSRFSLDLVFDLSLSSSASDPLSYSFPISYIVFYAPWSLILSANVFSISSSVVYPLVTTVYVSNDRRRTAFMEIQSRSFFNLAISPTAACRRTSVVGRRIFSSYPVKVHLKSI